MYQVAMPCGEGNISKSVYTIFVEQIDGENSNYTNANAEQVFSIIADPAPFDDSFVVWKYTISTDVDPDTGELVIHDVDTRGQTPDNRFRVDYVPGGTYTFYMWLNGRGMQGFDNAWYTDLDLALSSWEVTLASTTGNGLVASDAGQYYVTATITAKDSNRFSYYGGPFTLYYQIDPILFDLSGLSWDYTDPFTFDKDTFHTVQLTGNMPNGLAALYYENVKKYAGTYTATVAFKKNTNNYVLPVQPVEGQDSTYTGSFEWTCTWTIGKQMIEVGWAENGVSSDGEEIEIGRASCRERV